MANRRQLEEGFYLIEPQAKEMKTVGTSAVGLTSGTYGTYTRARIQAQDADVRFWITGDAPTSTEGELLYNKKVLELRTAAEISNFKAIRDTGAGVDAKLSVQYYK